MWHGKPLYFKAAPESSNIIWQNLHKPKLAKSVKRAVALLIILVILILQLIFMFSLKKKINAYLDEYPS